jgi:hypothetical protein
MTGKAYPGGYMLGKPDGDPSGSLRQTVTFFLVVSPNRRYSGQKPTAAVTSMTAATTNRMMPRKRQRRRQWRQSLG